MPDEIAEKDAVKIAEFLGFEPVIKLEGTGWYLKNGLFASGQNCLNAYLSFPEAQAAMMDKAFSEGFNIVFFHPVHPKRGDVGCQLERNFNTLEYFAPTFTEALMNAILEMLGKEGK